MCSYIKSPNRQSKNQPEADPFSSKSKPSQNALFEKIPAASLRGISLRSLRAIEATVKVLVAEGCFPKVSSYTELTTTDLVEGWIKKVTGTKRFVDCPDLFNFADAGVPQYFVSHAWKGSFALLVAHVLAYLKNALEDTRVWLDMFAVNQHGGPENPSEARQENLDDVASFKATLRLCMGTIVVVDLSRCNPASRGWCLYEWDKTITFCGLEALQFVGVSGKELNQIVRGVSVATAECFSPDDVAMIQREVTENHGSFAAFDEALKLALLLAPTSYKVDLEQLDLRSAGTLWNFDPVCSWLKDTTAPRALCIIGAAGTGKSSASAALLREVLGRPVAGQPGEWMGPPTAFHFLKHSDQRRLEPVAVLKSLVCQLGRRLAGLAAALCALEGEAMANLMTIEAACALLLQPLAVACAKHNGPVVIVVDALDEADPLEQQLPGFDPATHHVEPVANKTLHLVLAQLVLKLPTNVRFIFSARPDTLLGAIKPVLGRSFPSGVFYLQPNALRLGCGAADVGSSKESNLVYGTVVRGCQLVGKLEAPTGAPGLLDVYGAYAAAFARAPLKDGVRHLLEVVLAAFEPLPLALLQQIGLHVHLTALPGWDTLFYEADHHLHVLHKSLSDWLIAEWLPQNVGAESGGGGHKLLGAHLLEREVMTATDGGAAGGVAASVYALKYAVPHLVHSLGAGATQVAALDRALGRWPFTRQAFRAGHGAKLVAALGSVEVGGGLSDYGGDALRWLRRYFNDFERNAMTMEMVTMRGAPSSSSKYKEACIRLHELCLAEGKPSVLRTVLVLGCASLNSWPADTNIFKGHSDSVTSVAFSPNGRSLVTCSGDKTARVWDLVRGPCTATLEGHSGSVTSVTLSPNGQLLATGSEDKTARVWDLVSGQCTATLKGHSNVVSSVAFSPDRHSLATGSWDKTARLWDLTSGQCTATLEGHSNFVFSVAFSPSGCLLATGSKDDSARVWTLASAKCTAIFKGHTNVVTSVAFNSDGYLLATGSEDRTARVWDLASGQCTATLEDHSASVTCVAFSPSGRSLATGSFDKTARLWDLASGQCTATLEGHSEAVRGVAFSPNGRSLATGSWDKTARLWDLTSGQRNATLEGHSEDVWSVAFSPSGRLLATGSKDKTVRLWDLASGQCKNTLKGHSDSVNSVAFSPDGCLLATGSWDKSARLWDLASGQCTATLQGHSNFITSVAFSHDGRSLATGSWDKSARLWDLASGQCTATLKSHSNIISSVAFSPDGCLLATGSEDKTARLWDFASGQCTATLGGHSEGICSLAFSPSGRLLATGSRDFTARVWDLASGQCTATLKGHSNVVSSVAFSPSGRLLATGSKDDTARVWELASGQCAATLEGHSENVWSVAFSPDGRSLATGSVDKSARVWDLTCA